MLETPPHLTPTQASLLVQSTNLPMTISRQRWSCNHFRPGGCIAVYCIASPYFKRQASKDGCTRFTSFEARCLTQFVYVGPYNTYLNTLTCLKGKLGDFFLSAQSFYWPQTKTSYKIQFSPKSPKVGQKSGQRVQNSQNKNQVSSDLLGESTNSVIRAAGGIHQFCHLTCWGNPLIDNFSIRPTGGIHQFFHPTYCGNPFQYVFQSGGTAV